jgi:succinate dehydrogenase flavin-adding protein (antitoxin of CptAB toxin-antitoxin module)
LKHFYNCGYIILKHNNQQLTTKMNSKITKQDIAVGRIYRCSICDAKCDDTWGTKEGNLICGRFVEKEVPSIMQCSKDCNYKHLRDETRKNYEALLQGHEENLPKRVEFLKKSVAEKSEETSMVFKAVKFSKMTIKLLPRFISRQMTLAEIQAEFYTLSRLAMDIAEEWMEIVPDDTESYMYWVNVSSNSAIHVDGKGISKAWSVDYC